jgi:hypothetical protein
VRVAANGAVRRVQCAQLHCERKRPAPREVAGEILVKGLLYFTKNDLWF